MAFYNKRTPSKRGADGNLQDGVHLKISFLAAAWQFS
jgi:hypothetical protein